jgi:hypothetical protein
VATEIGPWAVFEQRLCGTSNRSVLGTLEVAVVVDGGQCVILYQWLFANSKRSVRVTLAEAVW